MTVIRPHPLVEIHVGHVLDVLRTLPEASAQTCVTSPPFWGLRSYLPDGHPDKVHEIGSESTLEAWLVRMVEVFRGVRRVLRPDGTLWVEMGDAYVAKRGQNTAKTRGQGSKLNGGAHYPGLDGPSPSASGLSPKSLIGLPWRLAFVLQDDGWILRSEIVWHKPNALPESVHDRPCRDHSTVFLLSRSARYSYDADAVKVPASPNTHARGVGTHPKQSVPGSGTRDNSSFAAAVNGHVDERNLRTVWSIPTFKFSGNHPAAFPPALVEPCIRASSKPGDLVLDPFGGSGTTGQVAQTLGRRAILIELSHEYAQLAAQRVVGEIPAPVVEARRDPRQIDLFRGML